MKIYLVYRNSDMTEGRGSMLLDEAFIHQKDADEYADTKSGIMGFRPKNGHWRDSGHGDWTVVERKVHESSLVEELQQREALRQQALGKLSDEELGVLGLKRE